MCQVSSSHPPSSVHAENPAAMEAKSFGCPEFHRGPWAPGPHESDPTKFNFIPLKPKFWTLFSRVAGVRFVDVLGSGIDLVRVFTRCFNLPLWKVKNQHSSTSPAEAFQCCFDYPWKRLVSLGVVLDKLRSFPVVVKLAELNRNRMATHLTQEVPHWSSAPCQEEGWSGRGSVSCCHTAPLFKNSGRPPSWRALVLQYQTPPSNDYRAKLAWKHELIWTWMRPNCGTQKHLQTEHRVSAVDDGLLSHRSGRPRACRSQVWRCLGKLMLGI